MYAIIKTGGKQYKVSAGTVVMVEKIKGDIGSSVVFDEVLAVGGDQQHVGQPFVDHASVHGTILAQEKGKKLLIFKKRRRKHYRRTRGHRQLLTRCRIDEIHVGSGS